MTEDPRTPGDLAGELRALGQNLRSVLQAAWDSDERRRFQQEFETGLGELADTLGKAAREFSESETGQQMKDELKDLGERLQSGEVESKVRQDLTTILRKVNEELGRAASSSGRPPTDPGSPA